MDLDWRPGSFKSLLAHMPISRKVLVIVLLPVVLEILAGAVLFGLSLQAEQEAAEEFHSKSILSDVTNVHKNVVTLGLAGYKLLKGGPDSLWQVVQSLRQDCRTSMENVLKETASYPEELRAAREMETALIRLLKVSSQGMKADIQQWDRFATLHATQLKIDVEQAIQKFMLASTRLKEIVGRRKQVGPTSTFYREALRYFILGLMGGNLVLGVFLAGLVSRQIGSRIDHICKETMLVRQRLPLPEGLAGNDELTRLDAFIHEMIADLEAAERMKKDFVAMVSHDLRSPLTSVQISLNLLETGSLGELPQRAVEAAGKMDLEVSRMLRLINTLLDYEKLESGQFELHRTACRLGPILESSLKSVELLASRAGVSLSAGVTDATVDIDQDKIIQVLVNLLANAIKFSQAGQSVELTALPSDGFVKISVIDQAPVYHLKTRPGFSRSTGRRATLPNLVAAEPDWVLQLCA